MKNSKILIVEDDLVTAKFLKRVLVAEGYQVEQVSNCSDALKGSERGNFVLLLVDYILPDGDGIELTRRLRELPENRWLPIIICTACDKDETLQHSFEVGCNDFIRKPPRRTEVVIRARNALRLREATLNQVEGNRRRLLLQVGALVAHEINNPLCAVCETVDALMSQRTSLEKSLKRLPLAAEGLERIATLVRDLRFLVAEEHTLAPTCLGEVLHLVRRLLAVRQRGSVSFATDIERCPILCDPGTTAQSFFAFANSLLDFADREGGGELRFVCRREAERAVARFELNTSNVQGWNLNCLETTLARRQLVGSLAVISVQQENSPIVIQVILPRLGSQPGTPCETGGELALLGQLL